MRLRKQMKRNADRTKNIIFPEREEEIHIILRRRERVLRTSSVGRIVGKQLNNVLIGEQLVAENQTSPAESSDDLA